MKSGSKASQALDRVCQSGRRGTPRCPPAASEEFAAPRSDYLLRHLPDGSNQAEPGAIVIEHRPQVVNAHLGKRLMADGKLDFLAAVLSLD
jgi:hypothetical protein